LGLPDAIKNKQITLRPTGSDGKWVLTKPSNTVEPVTLVEFQVLPTAGDAHMLRVTVKSEKDRPTIQAIAIELIDENKKVYRCALRPKPQLQTLKVAIDDEGKVVNPIPPPIPYVWPETLTWAKTGKMPPPPITQRITVGLEAFTVGLCQIGGSLKPRREDASYEADIEETDSSPYTHSFHLTGQLNSTSENNPGIKVAGVIKLPGFEGAKLSYMKGIREATRNAQDMKKAAVDAKGDKDKKDKQKRRDGWLRGKNTLRKKAGEAFGTLVAKTKGMIGPDVHAIHDVYGMPIAQLRWEFVPCTKDRWVPNPKARP